MDESTASDSSQDLKPTLSTDDVDVSGAPAVVFCTGINGQTECSALALDLHRDALSNTAFFKLRAKVALQDRRDKINLFLFIHPERIRTLALVDEDNFQAQAQDKLGGKSTYCLRFGLNQTAAWVVPKEVHLVPKHDKDVRVLSGMTVLAGQKSFVVYLSTATMPKRKLLSLCEAVTSCRSMQRHANLASLYGGKGGKVLECDKTGPPGLWVAEGPPAYTDIGPGPPSPPCAAQGKESASSRGKKRRRVASDAGATTDDEHVTVESICLRILSRMEEGFSTLNTRIGGIEQRLDALEAHVDKSFGQGSSELDVREVIDNRIEDEMAEVKRDLNMWMMDEVQDAKENLKGNVKRWLTSSTPRLELEFDFDET